MEALEHGIVSSTTAMMAVPGAQDRLRPHVAALRGRTGVHLQLSAGRPLSSPGRGSTLTDGDGSLPRWPKAMSTLDPGEVYDEWMAQVTQFVALGLKPTHVDTHRNVHHHPTLTDAYIKVALAWGIGCRAGTPGLGRKIRQSGVACPDLTDDHWTIQDRTIEGLREHLQRLADARLADGTAELVTHPGHVGADPVSSYTFGRREELTALSTDSARKLVSELGFELISYQGVTELSRG